jgi:hypothetical protein
MFMHDAIKMAKKRRRENINRTREDVFLALKNYFIRFSLVPLSPFVH